MKMLLLSVLMTLSCITGCRYTVAPQSENKAKQIVLGMSLAEVIRVHGSHYRLFCGPQTGDIALVYDDITVHLRGHTLPEIDGRVTKIEDTTKSITEWVKEVRYEDKKRENP